MATQRIEYIDALRGFTMILVVIHHILFFCFGLYHNAVNDILHIFRMPMFFLISGFLLYKGEAFWRGKHVISDFLRRKIRQQLFSTIFFLSLFLYIFHKNFQEMLFSVDKCGYWFTLMLFLYFTFFLVVQIIASILKLKKYWIDSLLLFSVACAYGMRYLYHHQYFEEYDIGNLLSMGHWGYYGYFILGYYTHRFFGKVQQFLDNSRMMACIIMGALVSFLLENMFPGARYLLRISALIIVFAFFRSYQQRFSLQTRMGRLLQYVGRCTLDVYLIHFFFLPYNLKFVGSFLLSHSNPLLEFLLAAILSFVVIGCCLICSNVIRLSPLLSYYILGTKKRSV